LTVHERAAEASPVVRYRPKLQHETTPSHPDIAQELSINRRAGSNRIDRCRSRQLSRDQLLSPEL